MASSGNRNGSGISNTSNLRIVRLLQVREQSKEIAKKLRLKADEEKRRQLASLEASKLRQFDANKHKSIARLRDKQNAFFVNIGDSHDAVVDVQQSAEEWKVQKELNQTVAKLRGTQARHRIYINPASKRPDSKAKRLKPHTSIKKTYSENAERDTECPNSANKSFIELPIPFVRSENRRISSAAFSSKRKLHASAECQTSFDFKTNEIKNNDRPNSKNFCENIDAAESEEFQLQKSNFNMKPLNLVSQYIKKRNAFQADTSQNVKSDTDKKSKETIDLELMRDVIRQSKHLNSGQNFSSKESTVDSMLNKYNSNMFSKSRHVKHYSKLPRKNGLTLNKSHVKMYKTEMKRNLRDPTVSWQIGRKELNKNEKFVESYDHSNKFLKNLAVNNRDFVEKLPTFEPNAFQRAQIEIEKRNKHQLQRECHCMNQEYEKKALNKIITEKENKKLLKNLELISTANYENVGHSSVKFTKNKKTDDFKSPKSKIMKGQHKRTTEESSLNVATWSMFPKEDHIHSSSEKGSDSSLKSILFDVNGNSSNTDGPSIGDILQMIERQKNALMCELMKVKKAKGVGKISKETKIESENVQKSSETSIDYIDNGKQKSRMLNSVSSSSLERVNVIEQTGNLTSKITENISESSKRSYSFQGLRIVIEVQKDKNKSKFITIKDQMIQTSKNISESSNEHYEKKSDFSIEKKLSNPNSFAKSSKSDMTESTTFMDLPDKITTNFDLHVEKCGNNNEKKMDTLTTNIATGNILQKNHIEIAKSGPQEHNSANKGTNDLKLRQYVLKLLNMSKTDMNKINIDVSDVPTPSSSVVNIPLNNEGDIICTEKFTQDMNFIKENYKILDEINHQHKLEKKSMKKSQHSISIEKNKEKIIKPIARPCRVIPNSDEETSKIPSDQLKNSNKSPVKNAESSKKLKIGNKESQPANKNRVLQSPLKCEIVPKALDIPSSPPVALTDNLGIQNEESLAYVPLFGDFSKTVGLNTNRLEVSNHPNLIAPNSIIMSNPEPVIILNRPASVFHSIPHELSTIIEVDTPKTMRSASILSKHETPIKGQKLISKLNTPESIDNTPSLHNELNNSDPNFKAFPSFREYLSKFDSADKDETSTSSESLTLNFLTNVASKKSEHSKASHTDIDADTDLSYKEEGVSRSVENKSADDIPEFKVWLKNNGLTWAIPTLKKTREAAALSSTSSSSVNSINSIKIKHLSNFSVGLSTLSDDLNLSDENFIEKIANESLSKLSIRKELEMLFKKKGIKSTNNGNNPSKVDKNMEREDGSNNSQDKSQHRTSTPVLIAKSQQSSSVEGGAHHISNALFSNDDDLSSVKNISNSDKNAHSDDRDTLTIPNATLKFNRLFNSSEISDK